jgi:hypothetical protein
VTLCGGARARTELFANDMRRRYRLMDAVEGLVDAVCRFRSRPALRRSGSVLRQFALGMAEQQERRVDAGAIGPRGSIR